MEEAKNGSSQLQYLPSDAEGECILAKIDPVRFNAIKFTLFVIASVIFAGIPILITIWYSKFKRIFYYDFTSLDQATHVAIINSDEQTTICQLYRDNLVLSQISTQHSLCFVNRYLRYTISSQRLVRVLLYDEKSRLQRITNSKKEVGLTETQAIGQRFAYGRGTMEINQPSWYYLAFKQIIRPLYLFLFFSVSLWIYQEYYIYAAIIGGTAILGIVTTIYSAVAVNNKIYQMAFNQIKVNTLRDGGVKSISSLDLVPGDIVFLKDPIKIPFEGIILQGSALINECALTGESVPIVKKADVRDHYTNLGTSIDKAAYVFEGTTIVQVNSKKKMAQFQSTRQAYGIPVCVTRTNFVTVKGQLIRIILFPKQQENIFQKQSGKFIVCLFFISIGTYFCIINHLKQVVQPLDIFIKFLDLIAITVPPALPVSMAFGILSAIEKLNKIKIFCIDTNKIVTGGGVNFSCFDKTGTLTEDFMDFQALIPADKAKFFDAILNRRQSKVNISQAIKSKPYLYEICNNMAANHSIVRIESTGEMIGDPMEIKLFDFGEFTLNQSHSDPEVVFSFESDRGQRGEVYRRFEFDSDLQRMSVVVRAASKELYAYAKGSPEMMATIMEKGSIPSNYNEVLKEYTSNGFRVLAIGSKRIQGNDHKNITRQNAETGLIFNGFQVFENKLKPETKGAIRELKEAQIGVVMITGDNALTGSNIGYKCGIAHRDQGMIICDYRDGKFTQEKFSFIEKEINNDDQVKPTPNLLQNNSPLQIQLHTHQKNKETSYQNLQNSSSQGFLNYIVDKAKKTRTQLCVTGSAFNKLFEGKVQEISDLKKEFLNCATVYARTKPNDKAKIVMVYQHTGRVVSMCGDGANDCGALKQADIGLSLSQAEASISAPFTSQIANISSMVQLIKECRAGLATNFTIFNIMAAYSLIQYTTTTIGYIYFGYPSQWEYLYWDVACNLFFVVFVGMTGTASKLSVQRPSNSLFCFSNLFQVMFAFLLNLAGQICMIAALSGTFNGTVRYSTIGGQAANKQTYIDNENSFPDNTIELSITFLFSNFMYIFTVLAFNIGSPWRKSFFTNIPFMVTLVIVSTYTILICIAPVTRLGAFNVNYMEDLRVNGFVLGMGLAFGLTVFILQKFVWEPLTQHFRQKYPEAIWI